PVAVRGDEPSRDDHSCVLTLVELSPHRKLSMMMFESNAVSPTSKVMSSRVIVSPGTTGASVVSHDVPPPTEASMPVPASSATPLGHVKQPVGLHTSKKPLLTDTGFPRPSNETFLSAGMPAAPVVRRAR